MYLPGGIPDWGGTCQRGVYLHMGGVPARRGVYLPEGGCTWLGGVPAQGGVPAGGVYLPGPGGCAWSGTPPPVNRMTDACENITLAKTSFRPVIKFFEQI